MMLFWIVIVGSFIIYIIFGIDFGVKDVIFEYKGGMGGDFIFFVELSVFNVVFIVQKFVKLTWVSESETNMFGYCVYCSETNDVNSVIQIIVMMIEVINISTIQVYSIEDCEVLFFSTYYYWLEAVDYNYSNFFGSQFVEVFGEVVFEFFVQIVMKNVYLNFFKTNVSINIEVVLKAGETGIVMIYNVFG